MFHAMLAGIGEVAAEEHRYAIKQAVSSLLRFPQLFQEFAEHFQFFDFEDFQ